MRHPLPRGHIWGKEPPPQGPGGGPLRRQGTRSRFQRRHSTRTRLRLWEGPGYPQDTPQGGAPTRCSLRRHGNQDYQGVVGKPRTDSQPRGDEEGIQVVQASLGQVRQEEGPQSQRDSHYQRHARRGTCPMVPKPPQTPPGERHPPDRLSGGGIGWPQADGGGQDTNLRQPHHSPPRN